MWISGKMSGGNRSFHWDSHVFCFVALKKGSKTAERNNYKFLFWDWENVSQMRWFPMEWMIEDTLVRSFYWWTLGGWFSLILYFKCFFSLPQISNEILGATFNLCWLEMRNNNFKKLIPNKFAIKHIFKLFKAPGKKVNIYSKL